MLRRVSSMTKRSPAVSISAAVWCAHASLAIPASPLRSVSTTTSTCFSPSAPSSPLVRHTSVSTQGHSTLSGTFSSCLTSPTLHNAQRYASTSAFGGDVGGGPEVASPPITESVDVMMSSALPTPARTKALKKKRVQRVSRPAAVPPVVADEQAVVEADASVPAVSEAKAQKKPPARAKRTAQPRAKLVVPPIATAETFVQAEGGLDYASEESFFTSLQEVERQVAQERRAAATGSDTAAFAESTLVYNALNGRMTSEDSLTIQCLRTIGFGINAQRQTIVERPDVLNAFAERIRAGTASIPSKWPVSLVKTVGNVLTNTAIDDPATALQQMVQIKINSITRSRYASVVSSLNEDGQVEVSGADALGMSDDNTETIKLNEEQEKVIDLALKGHHVYIGGSAGTGKTVLLRVLSRRLQAHRLRVAMTATTGVAGCHIGGSTFHHALGVSSNGEFLRRSTMLDYDTIIIDEVSMLSKQLFEDFDKVLREEAGTPDLPFGGVQVILCGDFLQLGCINEESIIHSKLFRDNFVTLRLETQVRQSTNPKFACDLQQMRLGQVPDDLTTTVQQLPAGTMVDSAVNLLPTNKEVHAANEKELARLPGDPLTLTPETGITALKMECTATLLLRTGANFNELEFSQHIRSLLQATLDLPRASLLSLYRIYEDGHVMRVMLPPGESVAWREAMKDRFLEVAGLINDLHLGVTVTEIAPSGDGLHTPETEEYLHKLMAKHPIAQPMTFKKGCRVLLRSNLTSSLVNGSIGTVVDFVECKPESFPEYLRSEAVDACIERYRVFCFTECGMPIPLVPVVKFHSGETVAVPPWEFSVGGGPTTQYYSLTSVALPLTLAYAFTVHKVQGLTLVGRVHLELSRMWPCEHLLYVAMSRVRNPEQLSMSSFRPSMVVANEDCVSFDKKLRHVLAMKEEEISRFPVSAWKHCNDTIYHLRRRGASLRSLLENVATAGGTNGVPVTHIHSHHGVKLLEQRARHSTSSEGSHADGSDAISHSTDGTSFASSSEHQNGLMGAVDPCVARLASINQSVLVARRMRKLVRHVERVAKLAETRRRSKVSVVASASAGASAHVVSEPEDVSEAITASQFSTSDDNEPEEFSL